MKLPDPLKHSPIYPDEDRNEQHSRARYVEGWNACLAEVVRLNDTEAPAAVEVSRLAEEVTRLVFNLGDIAWHAGKHGENVGTPYHATHEIFAAKLKALATMASPEVTLNGLTKAEMTASASVQGLSEAGRLASGEAIRTAASNALDVFQTICTYADAADLGPTVIEEIGDVCDELRAALAATQTSPTSAVERETGEAMSMVSETQRMLTMLNNARYYADLGPWASEHVRDEDAASSNMQANEDRRQFINELDEEIATLTQRDGIATPTAATPAEPVKAVAPPHFCQAWGSCSHCAICGLEMPVATHPSASTSAAHPLTDEEVDELLADLDEIAREHDVHEYGLPLMMDEPHAAMRDKVRACAEKWGIPLAESDNTNCKFAAGGARCVSHCGDPVCLNPKELS